MQWFIDNRPEFRESLQKFHYFLRDSFISVVAGPRNNRCRSPTPWPGSRLRCCPEMHAGLEVLRPTGSTVGELEQSAGSCRPAPAARGARILLGAGAGHPEVGRTAPAARPRPTRAGKILLAQNGDCRVLFFVRPTIELLIAGSQAADGADFQLFSSEIAITFFADSAKLPCSPSIEILEPQAETLCGAPQTGPQTAPGRSHRRGIHLRADPGPHR